jgi:tetratricopeptide (TPR) repeat protein
MDENISVNELVAEGKSAYNQGDYIAAARAYEAAAAGFQASGDTLTAAEMRNNSSVAYLKAGEAQTALNAVEGTPAIFASAGDVRRHGMSLGNLGSALEAVQRMPEAADAYRQSAELLEQAGEKDLRVYVMKSLSALQLRSGRHLEALATMQSGLEGIERPKPQERLLKRLLQAPFKFLGKSSNQSE